MEPKRKYIICLFEYNWHDGGADVCDFVKAKNGMEALLKRMREYYRWLRGFSTGYSAYIENVKVYEYILTRDEKCVPVHIIRGPILGLEGRITNEDVKEVSEKEFLDLVRKRVIDYTRIESMELPDSLRRIIEEVLSER